MISILVALCMGGVAQAQMKGTVVHFVPLYGGEPLRLDSTYADGMRFHTLRFYVSSIQIFDYKKGGSFDNACHLVDASDPNTMQIGVSTWQMPYRSLMFKLGIDSTTNVSGALGGDLDPAKGMYWTWQSGYINLKLEGTHPSCPTRGHEFQFHLGGYAAPYASLQSVHVTVNGGPLVVYIDLERFMKGIDLAKVNSVMVPGKEAAELAKKMAGAMTAKQ